ncbi:MAG TPA: hypothetical protein VEB64_15660 [Azospirillaceae bacterium]|nr:hypothetical protein [Azospirillaceae bacterium]
MLSFLLTSIMAHENKGVHELVGMKDADQKTVARALWNWVSYETYSGGEPNIKLKTIEDALSDIETSKGKGKKLSDYINRHPIGKTTRAGSEN